MAFSHDGTQVVSGVFEVTINSVAVGLTEDGFTLTMPEDATRILAHESGEVPVAIYRGPRPVTLSFSALQFNKNEMARAFPDGTATSSSTAAQVTVAGNVVQTTTTGVTIVLHPHSKGAATDEDVTLTNMAPAAGGIGEGFRRDGKLMFPVTYERLYVSTTTAAIQVGSTS